MAPSSGLSRSSTPPRGPSRMPWWPTASPSPSFAVDDVQGTWQRLTKLGVRFTQEPSTTGPVTTAILDDTCGNLIQLASQG